MSNRPVNSCHGILSYPKCHIPEAMKDSDKKRYTVSLLVPKDGTKKQKRWIKKLRADVKKAIAEKWKKKPRGIRVPYEDGDSEAFEGTKQESILAGNWNVKFSTEFKPEVIGSDGLPLSEEELYGGCVGVISYILRTYGDDKSVSKGVTLYFKHVIKLEDGEKLGEGGISANEQFEGLLDLPDLDDDDSDDDDDDLDDL